MVVLLCMHSGFPTKILEQTIVTSLYDVTRDSHGRMVGTIKEEHNGASGLLLLLSGCFETSLWVFVTHRPSTLAVSVPLK